VRRRPREAFIVYSNARNVAEHARVFRRPYLRLVAAELLFLIYTCSGLVV